MPPTTTNSPIHRTSRKRKANPKYLVSDILSMDEAQPLVFNIEYKETEFGVSDAE